MYGVLVAAKLGCLVTSLALIGSSGPLGGAWIDPVHESLAAFEDITPDTANAARFGVEQEGQQLSGSGNHQQAAELYWQKGIELKDPVLIVDAGEAWIEQARAQRSIDAAQT